MCEFGSVTKWIQNIGNKDQEAVQAIWERYFHRMVCTANQHLKNFPQSQGDGEDVAISAFFSFYKGVQRSMFPRLEDRNDLWQILLMLTRRKAIDHKKRESREIRDFRRTISMTNPNSASAGLGQFQEIISPEPDLDYVIEVQDLLRTLLDSLEDDNLRRICVQKMRGMTVNEIAQEFQLAKSTIERRLQLIRKCWISKSEKIEGNV